MKKLLIIAVVLAQVGPTFAQSSSSRGSKSEQDACRSDVTRHCRKVVGEGDMAILQCLQDNRKKLSKTCKQTLEDNGQ